MDGGRQVTFTNNIVSNCGQVYTGKPQLYFGNSTAVSETTSNNNTFYLPNDTFNVARVGSGSAMKLAGWQSYSGEDLNSTERLNEIYVEGV